MHHTRAYPHRMTGLDRVRDFERKSRGSSSNDRNPNNNTESVR